ncbi:MAG TPA: hypothetical protein PK196_00840 [Methanoculleus sp.]|jgi:hypothetical protein|nr:hypothetical protein [Methanoculleus sp.]HON40003.1 hypothetical protein [Methanoculleus sp.]HPD51645.1 hypothetical protein [Methanoculleus sp.]
MKPFPGSDYVLKKVAVRLPSDLSNHSLNIYLSVCPRIQKPVENTEIWITFTEEAGLHVFT